MGYPLESNEALSLESMQLHKAGSYANSPNHGGCVLFHHINSTHELIEQLQKQHHRGVEATLQFYSPPSSYFVRIKVAIRTPLCAQTLRTLSVTISFLHIPSLACTKS